MKPFLLLIPAKIVSRIKLRKINDGEDVAPTRNIFAAVLATLKTIEAVGILYPAIAPYIDGSH